MVTSRLGRVGRSLRLLPAFLLSETGLLFRRTAGFRDPVPEPFFQRADAHVPCGKGRGGHPGAGRPSLRVLVVSHNLNREGASISLCEMISALRRRGVIDPEVVYFEDGPLRDKYLAAGIPVSASRASDKCYTLRQLGAAVKSLVDVIRRRGVELVFVNTLRGYPAILAARAAGVGSVWNVRESAPPESFFSYLPEPVAKRAIAAGEFASRVVFVSHATRRSWQGLKGPRNATVIHNGIDLARFPELGRASERERCRVSLAVEAGTFVILCVGTICARKGQRDLVDSLRLLPRAVRERAQVMIVGDDRLPYAKYLKLRCRMLPRDIRSRIRFFPATESVQSFYAAADIFVLCSRQESFPRVTLEAMAFGLPIIATLVHGVPEQCVEGENAISYEAGNIRDLARRVEALARGQDLCRQMGESSRRRFTELDTFEAMTDAYASVVLQAANQAPPSAQQSSALL